jgi:hypothetical protein
MRVPPTIYVRLIPAGVRRTMKTVRTPLLTWREFVIAMVLATLAMLQAC